MSYGKKIKELRKVHNLTQSQLADKLFVSRQAVSLWEQDKVEPSKDTLLLLKDLYGISIDEWIEDNSLNPKKAKTCIFKRLFNKKAIIIMVSIVLCAAVITACSIGLVSRNKILYPQGYIKHSAIILKENILITTKSSGAVVFDEASKPQIICEIPDGFSEDADSKGLYLKSEDAYIRFDSDYEENVFNPIYGTEYYSFYQDKGYASYVNMSQLAMYVDLNKVSVFSKKEDIYLAGGARILRHYLCAGKDADYYAIDGGLTKDRKTMLIYGFALHFDDSAWLITLKDCNGCHYYITVKDVQGIGASHETIGNFLSSIVITENNINT